MPRFLKLALLISLATLALTQTRTQVDYNTNIKNVPVLGDSAEGTTLGQTCASAAGATVAVTKIWINMASQTLPCNLLFTGGRLQPAAANVVTIAGSIIAGNTPIFDVQFGGAGSISFAAPAPVVRTSWFGSTMGPNTCPNGDTLSGAWAGAQGSLPGVGSAPSIPVINQGAVEVGGNTGAGGNAYCISSTLPLIPRVSMRGSPLATTEIVATANFAPTTQKFMINTLQAQVPCNTNFNTSIENILLVGTTNAGNQFAGGIQWCPSIGSHLRDVVIYTSNVAISWGGPPVSGPANGGNSDNNTSDSITCDLFEVSTSVPYPQCIVAPTGGTDVSTTIITNVKVKGVGATTMAPSTIAPAIDPGLGNTNFIFNGVQCETIGWCAVIPDISTGIEIHALSMGGICSALSSYPRAVMVSPSAQAWHVSGFNTCVTYGVVIGSAPNGVIGLGINSGQTLIDPANHIQRATTNGTNGTTLETAWNDSGGATTWGTVTYTDGGAIGPCTIYVNTNCVATPGATSSSDQGVYGFDCNPERCISFNQVNPAINQTTYFQPINVATVNGNHFTSVSGTPMVSITGTGCMLGGLFVRDGGGAMGVGSGACAITVTFSANAQYHHAVIIVTQGTALASIGVADNLHFVINTQQAGTVFYTVMDTM